jgi:hypothetical protein
MHLTGSCYCREIKYEVTLSSPDEARTSLCHCKNCKVTSPIPSPMLHSSPSVHATSSETAFLI